MSFKVLAWNKLQWVTFELSKLTKEVGTILVLFYKEETEVK